MRRPRPLLPRPHASLRESTAFALRFVAGRMRKSVAQALAEDGYSWYEFAALTAASEAVGLSQGAISDWTAIDRTRICEALERLEDHALISRADPDRRRRPILITDSGRELRHHLARSVAEAERTALLPLDPRERARVGALLRKAIPPNRGLFGF